MNTAQDVYDGFFFDISEPEEDAPEPALVLFLIVERVFQLGAGDVAFLAQEFTNLGLACSGLIFNGGFET